VRKYANFVNLIVVIYGHPKGAAKAEKLPALKRHAINFVEYAPFTTVSTHAMSSSVDCSPREGRPQLVKIINEHCIIPDSKGNNRLGSLMKLGFKELELLKHHEHKMVSLQGLNLTEHAPKIS
tara:strand:+ start:108 stop:476 length:369 start_codon:yes stop_codon:yes gene_type:complete